MATAALTHELLRQLLADDRLSELAQILADSATPDVATVLHRASDRDLAISYRLLGKDKAMRVFERLDVGTQTALVGMLGESDTADVFAALDPDDRVELLDELPAKVARRLIRELPPSERASTGIVLGYPAGSIGRRMSPEYLHAHPGDTLGDVLRAVKARHAESETIYTIPVVDDTLRLQGVISLKDVLVGDAAALVADSMVTASSAIASEDSEAVARRCLDAGLLAMPVVDGEDRLVGILTIDDAARISQAAADEDQARAGASEPLRRPYLLTPVLALTQSRIVWLLVLAVSAMLTVSVLELFEATLEQMVALALFIPLLTGIGGNTGAQAATTVTRALAVGEVRPSDMLWVALKELRTGLLMGLGLAALGFAIASLVYDTGIGAVIAITLVSICTLSATVGGVMPLVAKLVRVDPAVFSTPFISTFCDASGLLVYFLTAKAVLGI